MLKASGESYWTILSLKASGESFFVISHWAILVTSFWMFIRVMCSSEVADGKKTPGKLYKDDNSQIEHGGES